MWVWISRWGGVLDTTLCDWVCQWFAAGLLFSTDTPVSSTNKTDRHIFNWNIVESGIKTITITLTLQKCIYMHLNCTVIIIQKW